MDEVAKAVKKRYDELSEQKQAIETELKPLEAYLKTAGLLNGKRERKKRDVKEPKERSV